MHNLVYINTAYINEYRYIYVYNIYTHASMHASGI